MSTPQYQDVTDEKLHEHNASAQHHVQRNNDPALDIAHEHHHAHLHHDARASMSHDQEVAYSKGTTYEKSAIPDQDPHDRHVHQQVDSSDTKSPAAFEDREKGPLSSDRSDEDPRTHTLSNFYIKNRIFFHMFIWLLFTG